MILRDIEVRVDEKYDLPVGLSKKARIVEHLYLRKLKRINTFEYNKVNIILTSFKEFELGGLLRDVLDCYIFFDFDKFRSLSSQEYDQKKMILDIILEALLKCSDQKGWGKDGFLDTYNDCLAEELKDEWFFKDKLFLSPDKKYYAGLYNIYNSDEYVVYLVIYDKSKKELARRLVFKDSMINFKLEWASWEGSNTTFYFKFNPPKKIFKHSVSDVLKKVPVQLFHRTSDWFKMDSENDTKKTFEDC